MPYQNDLSTLADVVSPVDAAVQAGLQNQFANQQEQAKAQVAQATVPQEIQKATLANQLLGAQGYAEQGLGMQNQAKGLADLYAAPSAAQAQVAGNQTKITGAHVEQLGQLGQIVGGIAQQMQNVNPLDRPYKMQQILDNFNVTDPSIRQLVASGDPNQLMQLSQGLTQASNQYRTQMASENVRGGYQLAAVGQEVAGREQVAKESADARRYAADVRAQTDRLKQTTDEALSQIVQRLGTPNEQPGDRERAQFLQQQSMQLRQMQSLTQQQLLGIGVPAANLGMIPQGQPGGGGGATPTVPTGTQPTTPDDAVTAEMKRRGLIK